MRSINRTELRLHPLASLEVHRQRYLDSVGSDRSVADEAGHSHLSRMSSLTLLRLMARSSYQELFPQKLSLSGFALT